MLDGAVFGAVEFLLSLVLDGAVFGTVEFLLSLVVCGLELLLLW
jgi:hypothetical protein